MIILSLLNRDPAVLRRAIVAAPQKAGAVEVRLDALRGVDLPMLQVMFEGAPRPLIATCRPAGQGGLYRGSERRRAEILWSAVRAGATYVDVEAGSEAAASLLAAGREHPGIGIILSFHDTRGMPRDPLALYRRLARTRGVKVVKIIGTARRVEDNLKVHDLLSRAHRGAVPLISFCMGPEGVPSRILALEWGSWATYASATNGEATAPGQISLTDLVGVYRIEDIDDETRYAGIIGTPLGHTLSPAMHNAAYHAEGLNFRYLPLEVSSASELRRLAPVARALHLRGLSVTAPYKIAIMRQLDRVEPIARRVGAVNTVIFEGRRLIGFNTDASGGMSALNEALRDLKMSPGSVRAAVVGSGGTARSLAHGLAAGGAHVLIASRSQRPGRALARAVGGEYVPLARLASRSYDVLVNATPVGMAQGARRDGPQLPVPRAAVKGKLVYDVVYRPEATGLLKLARERGIATLGGMEMLVRQAAEQHVLFTGRTPPVEAMREAARQALKPPADS
jgi:3-dehydroquinate dehydratase/shikimate dehydrogenase